MIGLTTVDPLKHAPIEERLRIIELILLSQEGYRKRA